MTDLLNIAKENSERWFTEYENESENVVIVFSESELRATVEKVCAEFVDAVTALLTYDGTDTEECIDLMHNYEIAIELANTSLFNYRKLMGKINDRPRPTTIH